METHQLPQIPDQCLVATRALNSFFVDLDLLLKVDHPILRTVHVWLCTHASGLPRTRQRHLGRRRHHRNICQNVGFATPPVHGHLFVMCSLHPYFPPPHVTSSPPSTKRLFISCLSVALCRAYIPSQKRNQTQLLQNMLQHRCLCNSRFELRRSVFVGATSSIQMLVSHHSLFRPPSLVMKSFLLNKSLRFRAIRFLSSSIPPLGKIYVHPLVGAIEASVPAWDSALVIVGAATAIKEREKDAFELVEEPPCIDVKL